MRIGRCVALTALLVCLAGCAVAPGSPQVHPPSAPNPPPPNDAAEPQTLRMRIAVSGVRPLVLAPQAVVDLPTQQKTLEQVRQRLQPTENQSIRVAELRREEGLQILGRTVDYFTVDNDQIDVTFAGDQVVGITSRAYHFDPLLSPDGKSLAFNDRDRLIKIYDLASGEIATVPMIEAKPDLPKPPSWGMDLTWSSDSEHLYFLGNPEGEARLFRVRRDGSELERLFPDRSFWAIHGWIQREALVVSSAFNREVMTISPTGVFKTIGEQTVTTGEISPSGNLLITGTENAIEIHDFQTSDLQRIQLPKYAALHSTVGWSSSEQRFATIMSMYDGPDSHRNNRNYLVVVDRRSGGLQSFELPQEWSRWGRQPCSWIDENSFVYSYSVYYSLMDNQLFVQIEP